MSTGRKLTLGLTIFLGIVGIFCLLLWLFGDWGHHPSVVDVESPVVETEEASRDDDAIEPAPIASNEDVTKEAIDEEQTEEPADERTPLLTGRVFGEAGDIIGARVLLFSVREIEAIIGRLERFDPGSGLPDIPAIIAAVKGELRRFRDAGIEAKSNDEGKYAFYDIQAKPYFVLAIADGYVFRYGDVISIVRDQTTTLDLELDRGAVISGRVVDEWEEGIPGVVVTAEYRPPGMQGVGKIVQKLLGYVNGEFLKGPFQSTTAEDGSFRIDSLPPAVYDLLAEKAGLPEARLEAVATGTNEAVIPLLPGVRIKGLLYDIRAGQPARNIPITLVPEVQAMALPFPGASDIAEIVGRIINESELETVSAKDGSFHFENIGPARFKLEIKTQGYLPIRKDVAVEAGERVHNLGTISVDSGGTITGWVRASGGAPVNAGTVTVIPVGANFMTMGSTLGEMVSGRTRVSTDSNGYFKVTGLASAKYGVLAQARGYGGASKRDVEPGGEPIELALEPGVTIRGLVVAAESETELAGVRIRASGVFTETDDEGRFTLEGVAPRDGQTMNPFAGMRRFGDRSRPEERETSASTVDVRASMSGYQDESQIVKLSEAGREVVIELAPKSQVLGIALGPDGAPLPGALLRLVPSGSDEIPFLPKGLVFVAAGVSNLDGEFSLGAPAEDARYSVLASHPLYASTQSDSFTPSEIEDRVEVRLTPGGTVRGIVTDGLQAIPGARVRISKHREMNVQQRMFMNMLGLPKGGTMAFTTNEGRYSYERMLPGNYVVSAEVAGFPEKSVEKFTLSENETREINIVLDPGGSIVGETISQDGEPIAGVRVRLIKQAGPDRMLRVQRMFGGAFKSAMSNTDGTFAVPGLPTTSRYTVIAEKSGFTSKTVVDVDPGDPSVELILVAEARIEGRVVDAATGAPLNLYEFRIVRRTDLSPSPEADELTWFDRAHKQVSDSDGRFSKNKLDAGRYSVEVRADTYASTAEEVVLLPGDVKELTIAMEPAGILVGKVLDAETGQPIAGVRIALATVPAETDSEAGETDAGTSRNPGEAARRHFEREMLGDAVYSGNGGEFVLETFPLEPQTVVFTHNEFIQEHRDNVEVTLGEELELTVRMKKGLSISGTVADASGETLSEGFLLLQGASDSVRRIEKVVVLDRSGKFLIGGLKTGVYTLNLSRRSSEGQQSVSQSVEVGEENVEGIAFVAE